jgi:hypothetical protein
VDTTYSRSRRAGHRPWPNRVYRSVRRSPALMAVVGVFTLLAALTVTFCVPLVAMGSPTAAHHPGGRAQTSQTDEVLVAGGVVMRAAADTTTCELSSFTPLASPIAWFAWPVNVPFGPPPDMLSGYTPVASPGLDGSTIYTWMVRPSTTVLVAKFAYRTNSRHGNACHIVIGMARHQGPLFNMGAGQPPAHFTDVVATVPRGAHLAYAVLVVIAGA